jgi:hypothetical protein
MTKKIVFTIVAVAVGLVALMLVGFAWYPSLVRLEPAYKQAQAICESITAGMTYEDVNNKVGYLFFSEPSTYVDKQGDGQAQLRNDVKGLDTTCLIKFENGKVISSGMAYVWL